MEEAKRTYNDPHLWLALGSSYEPIGSSAKAEEHYLRAANMIPHKFYPRYLLTKLLMKIGKTDEAIAEGKKLLSLREKISSPAILEMKEEIRKMILGSQTFRKY
jgi:tetratricopeptide (TPR) repeat protein